MSSLQEALLEIESDACGVESGSRVPHARRGGAKFRDPLEFALFPDALGQKIPADHLVRGIAWAVQAMDFSFLTRLYAHRGGTPYHPLNMLAVVLYGIIDEVRESRDLEEHCLYDARYRFLMGGLEPDDRTFGRFLERLEGKEDDILKSVLDFARKQAMGRGNEVAVDGSKMPGAASWWERDRVRDGTCSDPDVRLMNSHGRRSLGYNVQIAVDTGDGLILGAKVCQDQADWHVAPSVMEAVRAQSGELPARMVADSGYETPATILTLEEMGIETAIAPSENLPEEVMENADGELCCKGGRALVWVGITEVEKGRPYDRYGPEGGCRGCPLSKSCAFKGKRLSVPLGTDAGAKIRNRDRVRSDACQGAMIRRRGVETVFAVLRRHDGFDRFLRKGKGKAQVDFVIWAVSYNLRKILKRLWPLFTTICAILLNRLLDTFEGDRPRRYSLALNWR